jgi:ApaG protein
MYRAVTRHIEVVVEPSFLPERSSAEDGRFFWAYTIVDYQLRN